MGRKPCCDKMGLKKGTWTAEEDEILVNYINKNGGHGSWRSLPKLAGLLRCGKSCRLRWTNYLRPDIKRGSFTLEEEKLIIQLHGILGNRAIYFLNPKERHLGPSAYEEQLSSLRWAAIASQLPGRTDNEIKNLWNTHLKKRLISMGLDPQTHQPLVSPHNLNDKAHASSTSTRHMAQWESARLEAEARLSREPHFNNTNNNNKTDSDYFIRIWNSEVGESFRDVHKSESSIKCESLSATTTTTTTDLASSTPASIVKKEFFWGVKKIVCDSSSSSSELEHDSCDTSLQLLLDFPINNDMSFLEL